MLILQVASVLTALIVSSVLVLFSRKIAHVLGLLDHPSDRKRHIGAVPLMGGVSIFFGAWSGMWLLSDSLSRFWPLLLATLMILLVGVLDDRYNLAVKSRLVVQVLATLVIVFGEQVSLQSLGNLLGMGDIDLGQWFGLFFTLIAVVGVINALNMVDGIDGLAGLLTLLALAVMGVLSWGAGAIDEAWIALLFSVALIPYLLANLGTFGLKRRIFLGDAGSMLLGFLVAWLAIVLSQPQRDGGVAVFAPVTALWLFVIPVVDTVSIMMRRALKGDSPFLPDRDHLHHIVMRMGYRDRHALLFIVFTAMLLGGLGLWMEFNGVAEWTRFALFVAFSVLYALLLRRI